MPSSLLRVLYNINIVPPRALCARGGFLIFLQLIGIYPKFYAGLRLGIDLCEAEK